MEILFTKTEQIHIMRKTVTAFAIAAIFTACTSKPNPTTDAISLMADTTSLNDSSWTEKSADFNLDGVNDTIVSGDGSRYVKLNTNRTITKTTTTTKTTIAATPGRKITRTKTTGSTGVTSTEGTSSGTQSSTGTTTSTPTVAKKKGWSNSAKGAVIGAGTGAAAGAIIGKNKVKSAVIGGVLGAGGGFVIGKILDKKADTSQ